MGDSIVYKGYRIYEFKYLTVYMSEFGKIKRYRIEGFATQFQTITEAKMFIDCAPNLIQYKEPN